MAELSASEVFVRDMTEVLTFPDGLSERFISGPWGMKAPPSWSQTNLLLSMNDQLQSNADENLMPEEYPNTTIYTSSTCVETLVPTADPVPISRESPVPKNDDGQSENKAATDATISSPSDQEPAAARPALPWVSNGKLVGQRYYGDYCINPLKKSEVVVLFPDPPEAIVADAAVSSCVII